jgi:hypothetical protein
MERLPGPSMLVELKAHHRRISECIYEVSRITSQDTPDLRGLSLARVRLSKASSDRARFITNTVYPALQASAGEALHDQLVGMAHDFGRKRQASSEHVVRWSTKSIEANWDGYRAASLGIRTMMKARIEREIAVLYGPLAALRSNAARG